MQTYLDVYFWDALIQEQIEIFISVSMDNIPTWFPKLEIPKFAL